MPDKGPKGGHKRSVTVVVSGQQVVVTVNANQKVSQLVREALRESANAGRDLDEWVLKAESGATIDHDQTVEAANIADGSTLFLAPAEGGGG